MTCDSVGKLIPLYFYGELNPDEEEGVEAHLHECALCSREMERQRKMAVAFDARQADAPPFLLEDCRADLMAGIRGETRQPQRAPKGPWTLFLEAMSSTLGGFVRLRQPLGALALIAVGFFAARFTGNTPAAAPDGAPARLVSVPSENVFATIRSVQPDSSGGVKIDFDETRRRVVSGRMDNQDIQRLLLAAAHEENPSVRLDSVDVLKSNPGATEVRDALLNAVAHDPNAGVRMKALEGLRSLAGDARVRNTLSQVLLADENPAVRMQVVDLLVTHRDDALVGILQGLVQREDNNSVRQKLEKALKEMNASIGTF